MGVIKIPHADFNFALDINPALLNKTQFSNSNGSPSFKLSKYICNYRQSTDLLLRLCLNEKHLCIFTEIR